MEGEYLRKTLLEFAEYWNTDNDIGIEEIRKEKIIEYIAYRKHNTKSTCNYKGILDIIHIRVKTDKDYYTFTEVFVLLHNGKDYCSCNN